MESSGTLLLRLGFGGGGGVGTTAENRRFFYMEVDWDFREASPAGKVGRGACSGSIIASPADSNGDLKRHTL
jgi:hypothetical protein